MENISKQIKNEQININNVSNFLAILDQYCIKNTQYHTVFFRGSSNEKYQEIPSIFRDKNYIINEHIMFNELVRHCSQYFKECQTIFDYLVVMQHYSFPTRLLDITENPLVALYFACIGNSNHNGKVNIYKIHNEEIKNYDDITVNNKASLAKEQNTNIILSRVNLFMETYEYAKEINSQKYLFDRYSNTQIRLILQAIIDLYILLIKKIEFDYLLNFFEQHILLLSEIISSDEDIITKIFENNLFDGYEYNLSNNTYICDDFAIFFEKRKCPLFIKPKHTDNIKNFPKFDSFKFNQVSGVICVNPRLDNQRVIRQAGSFFLFGLENNSPDKNICPAIPNHYHFEENGKKVEIIIPNDKKQFIENELKLLSISQSHLFPEIETVAASLKKKYQNH